MRRFHVASALVVLALPASGVASFRILPQPPPAPLGTLLQKAKTIHVLKVEAVGPGGIKFSTKGALKGKAEEAPFQFLKLIRSFGQKEEELFHAGDVVLCFGASECAALHVSGRWALAVESDGEQEKNWLCMAEHGFAVTYDGRTAELAEHVAAILAGREVTLTARMPTPGGACGRLCRIKAGKDVNSFILSEESPYFVGWGTGDPEEVATLTTALRAEAAWDRIRAAGELAHLGPSARPALAALRRRMERLLASLEWPYPLEQRRRLRAVRLLEEMAALEARALLEKLAGGDARFLLTREAKAALHRRDSGSR